MGVRDSNVWGLVFLRSGVCNFYVLVLVFLRLGVRNSYVRVLVILTFGVRIFYVWGYFSYVYGLVFLSLVVSFLTFVG